MPTNSERRARAENALDAYRIACAGLQDEDCVVQDLITDLLHAHGKEGAELVLQSALMNFEAEASEEEEADR